MDWAPIVLGWPAAIAGILLSGLGLLNGKWVLVLAGALVALPFMLYLSGYPIVGPAALLAVACHLAAVAVLRRQRTVAAWLLFPPMPTVVTATAIVIGLSAR
jgi:hypothetical protein